MHTILICFIVFSCFLAPYSVGAHRTFFNPVRSNHSINRSPHRPNQYTMRVRTLLPWYLEFQFDLWHNMNFQPESLYILRHFNVMNSREDTRRILFAPTNHAYFKNFRNRMPLNFAVGEKINIELQYAYNSQSNGSDDKGPTSAHTEQVREKSHVEFMYTIRDVDKDTVTITLDHNNAQTSLAPQAATTISSKLSDNSPTSQSKNSSKSTTESVMHERTAATDLQPPPCLDEFSSTAEVEESKTESIILTNATNRLLLKASNWTNPKNAVDTVREFIVNTLELPHLAYDILQAKYVDDGLLFEMSQPVRTTEVLNQAKVILDQSALDANTFSLSGSELDFIDMSLLQRSLSDT